MKKQIYKLLSLAIATTSFMGSLSAQSLFKDLNPGTTSTNIYTHKILSDKFYFVTGITSGSQAKFQLWKSDGTAANTVMVNDSIIKSNNGNRVELIDEINGFMYYALTPSPSVGSVQLWKTDGTMAGSSLITTLDFTIGQGAAPKHFTVVGNKIFFIHGKDNGTELWVTDGTAAGTMEVIDLAPGNSGPIKSPGVEIKPMVSYKGKVYFSGSNIPGNYELYSSDGTAAGTTLVKDLNTKPNSGGEPAQWFIVNDELYFNAGDNDGSNIWKTDGTVTTKVSSTNQASRLMAYKNNLYFISLNQLWKSDGTAAGTALLTDSVGETLNAFINDNAFTTYSRFKPVFPYYDYFYWKIDLSTGAKTAVSSKITSTITNEIAEGKMYSTRLDSGSTTSAGLWVNDGTEEGTKKIFDGTYIGYPFTFNNDVYFTNYDSEHGGELWKLDLSPSSGLVFNATASSIPVYPNPSEGKFTIEHHSENMVVEVFGVNGMKVLQQTKNIVDLTGKPTGLYFIKITDGESIYTSKVLLK